MSPRHGPSLSCRRSFDAAANLAPVVAAPFVPGRASAHHADPMADVGERPRPVRRPGQDRNDQPTSKLALMAVLHKGSTISPTKPELLAKVLDGPVEIVGTYRFDDPAGEVGVEAFVVRRGERLQHVVLTYRGSPLDDGESYLISTMKHSELGPRWVYDGVGDPIAIECFHAALLGQPEQAVLELWENGEFVGTREPTVRLVTRPGTVNGAGTVRILRDLTPTDDSTLHPTLIAAWTDGQAPVAELV